MEVLCVQEEDGIRDAKEARGRGEEDKRQVDVGVVMVVKCIVSAYPNFKNTVKHIPIFSR